MPSTPFLLGDVVDSFFDVWLDCHKWPVVTNGVLTAHPYIVFAVQHIGLFPCLKFLPSTWIFPMQIMALLICKWLMLCTEYSLWLFWPNFLLMNWYSCTITCCTPALNEVFKIDHNHISQSNTLYVNPDKKSTQWAIFAWSFVHLSSLL